MGGDTGKRLIIQRLTFTMPTGLEEASAILTFVQVGFSLARTFTTLIGEYREAPDELATLANAIVDTLAHIETIKRLLEENETTHGWNANGIDLATSCLQEAERLVKRKQEKKPREDEIDKDDEEEVFRNLLGLGDDELVQQLLETYTNTRPS